MDPVTRAVALYKSSILIEIFLVPALLCLILALVFQRRAELSWHAVQNTAATLVVVFVNYGFALWFFRDIAAVLQTGYDLLRIPQLDAAIWNGWPIWLLAILGLAAKDLVDYWNHRLMHTRLGWPTHAAHHSDTHVNAFTAFRIHAIEMVMMTAGHIMMLTWLQMPHVIPAALILSGLHTMYVHMDLPWRHGPLKLLVASPSFHRWHHADVPAAYGKNLANHVPLWDKLFGTYYDPGPCRDVPMGATSSGVEDKDPVAILTYPVREWARMWSARRSAKPAPPTHSHI
ncbi:sterol desaturase family protein [Jannaschia sp. KMU-145]|uniref:sterol desaturase family protein n=1 Tax=Jannaschia halovivens TaxID=3388667 RepID=UPI00396B08A3